VLAVPPSQLVPVLHQLFIVGPGLSPIRAKLVSQIVAGKYKDLTEFLSTNVTLTEPEPQLLFDGHVVLRSQETQAAN